jgi:hypothetical protein
LEKSLFVEKRSHKFSQFEEIAEKKIKIKLSNLIEPLDISFSDEN